MKIQKETINVRYNADIKCVVMDVLSYSTPEQIRIGAAKALELFLSNDAQAVCVKQSISEEPNFIKNDWVIDTWFPNLLENGLKQSALVVSEAFYRSINPSLRLTKVGTVHYGYFTSEAEAIKWLKTKK